MLDAEVVGPVGGVRPVADMVGQPVGRGRQFQRGVAAEILLDDLLELVVALADAPLGSAMDFAFRLGLASVKRLERVGVIMAEHAGGEDGFFPVLLTK